MESVGRINPSMSQVLTGEVQVSGIQSPTKLMLDLVLPNGSLYPVNNISVNQDGIYNIFELIDIGTTFGGPVGTVAGAIVGGLASGSFIFAEYLYDNE